MSRWTAGGVVSRIMALSLREAEADVVFLTPRPEEAPPGLRTARHPSYSYLPGEWTLRKMTSWKKTSATLRCAQEAGVDVLLPDVEALGSPSLPAVGWIPDFQH